MVNLAIVLYDCPKACVGVIKNGHLNVHYFLKHFSFNFENQQLLLVMQDQCFCSMIFAKRNIFTRNSILIHALAERSTYATTDMQYLQQCSFVLKLDLIAMTLHDLTHFILMHTHIEN